MAKNELTDYQKKILSRLEKGEILSHTSLGMFTQAFRFKGDKNGINSNSLQKLRSGKHIIATDKMTMHGLVEYLHLPSQQPWRKEPSWQQYQIYRDTGGKRR